MTWAERTLSVRLLGTVPYGEAVTLQEELVRSRRSGDIGDQLLLLQHPHVVTKGSGSDQENLLVSERGFAQRGIEVFESGRGGDVTYHGPGQIVGYPILDLKPDRKDLHAYLRTLEGVLIATLARFGLEGRREEGLTGVWVGGEKVAALGIRVSSGWITSHGFALNVATDLSYFETIVPCGIVGRGVTSLESLLGRSVDPLEVYPHLVEDLSEAFGFGDVVQDPSEFTSASGA